MFAVSCTLIPHTIWVPASICVISVIEHIVVEGKSIPSVNISTEFELSKQPTRSRTYCFESNIEVTKKIIVISTEYFILKISVISWIVFTHRCQSERMPL